MTKRTISHELRTFHAFGEMLSYLRRRLSLSQREFARRVGYHYSYISRLEKNERKPDLSVLQSLFIPALKLEDEPEYAARLLKLAEASALAEVQALGTGAATGPAPSAGFPVSLTPLLGREKESSALINFLSDDQIRLVTVIGPPGVGKTRLTLHVVEQVSAKFKDGTVFVDLMAVFEAGQLLPAIAAALGVHEAAKESLTQRVKSALRGKQMLIMMDNFEQILEASPQILPLLGESPYIKIIATSREALRLRGEQEFPLTPLAVPGKEIEQAVADFPSVQLFLQRARSVKPDFQLDEETASRAADICRRLDGLPLAIELAAARVRTLSLSAMLEQFDRRFDWLTQGARDLPAWRQNLWDAVEWSYALLNNQERTLLNRLSVFNGGWTRAAAEAVCSDDLICVPHDIPNLLNQLVDKSLVTVDVRTERYHFLETLREFAHEKLKAGADLERMRQRHAGYYMDFVQAAMPHLAQGSEQVLWLDRIEAEHTNVRMALTWSAETPERAELATGFALAMCRFWIRRSYFSEARRWLDQILALSSEPTIQRSDLLGFAGNFSRIQGDYEDAHAFEEQALAVARALDYKNGIYASIDGLAILAGQRADYAQAAELLEQVLAYRRETNDTTLLTPTLNNLAIASRRLGNLDRARELYTEAISINRANNNLMSLGHALNGLSEIYVSLKEYASALDLQRESLSIRKQLGDMKGVAFSLGSMAISLYHLDEPMLATQMESASQKIYQDIKISSPSVAQVEHEQLMDALRSRLGDVRFKQAWSEGQALSLEQIVALATSSSHPKRKDRKRK